MSQADPAFTSFERKWLSEFPENAVLAVFLPIGQRQSVNAFGSLIHELTQTAFHRSEPQITATKLAWWQQELIDAHGGQPRHPITIVLFADASIRSSDLSLWPALADASLLEVEHRNAADVAELLRRLQPWQRAVARADAVVFSTGRADDEFAAKLAAISHLLREMSRIAAHPDSRNLQQIPVPLNLLARHGISRSDLINRSAARNAFARDYLAALLEQLDDCLNRACTFSLPRRVRTALDRRRIMQAQHAHDPLDWLADHQQPSNVRGLWIAWREAQKCSVA